MYRRIDLKFGGNASAYTPKGFGVWLPHACWWNEAAMLQEDVAQEDIVALYTYNTWAFGHRTPHHKKVQW